jgi:hypothetical protein
MRYYYTDAANQPAGPCDLSQLKALAAEGKINDLTSVIPEGGQTWTTYGAVKATATPSASSSSGASGPKMDSISTILGDNVAKLHGLLSRWLSANLLETSLRFGARYGHYAVLAGAVFGLILAGKVAANEHLFSVFATGGIGFVLAVAIGQYAAQRFMTAGAKIIANTPNRLSSKSFLDVVGLFAVLGAVGALVGGIVASMNTNSMVPLIPALLMTAYLLYFAMTALHPEQLNVSVAGETTAGQEAISLLSFFLKVGLKLAPLYFFLLAVAGALFTLLALFNIGQEYSQVVLSMLPLPLPPTLATVAQNSPGQMLVLVACLVPVLIYFFFLLWYLVLDLARAILAVPGKLDELKRS